MVSVSGMRLKQKGRGFDPHSGRSVVSLSKIGLGSTHFMILIRVNKDLSTHFGIGGGEEAGQWRIQRGFRGFALTPHLELNYFIYMGNFRKNEATLLKKTNPPFYI